jgi:hypothetical protein
VRCSAVRASLRARLRLAYCLLHDARVLHDSALLADYTRGMMGYHLVRLTRLFGGAGA